MVRDYILLFLALVLAITAAIFDVQQRRIPNRLTYPAMVIGVVLRTIFFHWKGLSSAIVGTLLLGGIMFVFYAVRAMGAGDVKLMAAIGSLVGPAHGLVVLLATAIVGGVLAVAYAAFRGRMRTTFKNMCSVILFHARTGLQTHPELNLDNPATLRLPYGLAIAAGTLYAVLAMRWS